MSPGGKQAPVVSGPAASEQPQGGKEEKGKSCELSPHLRRLQGRLCEFRDISDQEGGRCSEKRRKVAATAILVPRGYWVRAGAGRDGVGGGERLY